MPSECSPETACESPAIALPVYWLRGNFWHNTTPRRAHLWGYWSKKVCVGIGSFGPAGCGPCTWPPDGAVLVKRGKAAASAHAAAHAAAAAAAAAHAAAAHATAGS